MKNQLCIIGIIAAQQAAGAGSAFAGQQLIRWELGLALAIAAGVVTGGGLLFLMQSGSETGR